MPSIRDRAEAPAGIEADTTRMIVAGVDVGAKWIHCVCLGEQGALMDAAVFETTEPEIDRAVELLGRADVVAIDAPERPVPDAAAPHPGIEGKFALARCAEIALGRHERIWVPWVTATLANAPAWMRVGFDLFERLRDRTQAIEVYPHGAFLVLNDRRPLAKKPTPEGARQRIALLRSRHPDRPNLETWSHDSLDALVAAEVAFDALNGRAQRVPEFEHDCGRYDGSAIWLPARR